MVNLFWLRKSRGEFYPLIETGVVVMAAVEQTRLEEADLLDTGIFNDSRYFDVVVEHKITARGLGPIVGAATCLATTGAP
jgi:hypothetical protein